MRPARESDRLAIRSTFDDPQLNIGVSRGDRERQLKIPAPGYRKHPLIGTSGGTTVQYLHLSIGSRGYRKTGQAPGQRHRAPVVRTQVISDPIG